MVRMGPLPQVACATGRYGDWRGFTTVCPLSILQCADPHPSPMVALPPVVMIVAFQNQGQDRSTRGASSARACGTWHPPVVNAQGYQTRYMRQAVDTAQGRVWKGEGAPPLLGPVPEKRKVSKKFTLACGQGRR